MFDRVGEIVYPLSAGTADAMFEAALECGADNVDSDEEGHAFSCPVSSFASVREALEIRFAAPPQRAGLVWRPNIYVTISGDLATALMKLIDGLEDLDDVQTVTCNMEFSEAEMTRLTQQAG